MIVYWQRFLTRDRSRETRSRETFGGIERRPRLKKFELISMRRSPLAYNSCFTGSGRVRALRPNLGACHASCWSTSPARPQVRKRSERYRRLNARRRQALRVG